MNFITWCATFKNHWNRKHWGKTHSFIVISTSCIWIRILTSFNKLMVLLLIIEWTLEGLLIFFFKSVLWVEEKKSPVKCCNSRPVLGQSRLNRRPSPKQESLNWVTGMTPLGLAGVAWRCTPCLLTGLLEGFMTLSCYKYGWREANVEISL